MIFETGIEETAYDKGFDHGKEVGRWEAKEMACIILNKQIDELFAKQDVQTMLIVQNVLDKVMDIK
jgi:hypothetical protein